MPFPDLSFADADVDAPLQQPGNPARNPADNTPDSKPGKLPQESLNEFWDGLITKAPGKIFQIFPRSLYANLLPPIEPEGVASKKSAAASYEEAAQECREKVRRIVRECERTNEKFTDPDFNLEDDWKRNCLNGLQVPTAPGSNDAEGGRNAVGPGSLRDALRVLVQSNVLGTNTSVSLDVSALQRALEDDDSDSDDDEMYPGSVHRVEYIFDNPAFLVDGFSSSDVQQGAIGDCWWVAAVATLCSMPELAEKVCVERNAECGVYGFVFYRDGEWVSSVVDDNLYLSNEDFDAFGDVYDATGEKERKYKQRYQTGSEALYFAKCADPNEIWLPLLEKAYAKIHGDYDAIQAGDSGEGVEDITGGVSVTLFTNRILSKEKLWQELLNVNKEFIFAASSPGWRTDRRARQGVALNHAYSILKAVEVVGEDDKKVRLVLIRNPWGKRSWDGVGEWSGPWSDGSKEWTPYWIKKLNYRFGDDGEFWMSYTDLCRKFEALHRTRLFGDEWLVAQQWTSINVSWVSGYMTTKFIIEVKKGGTVVVVLSQLDSRYFRRLEGQYSFNLQFLLQEENSKPGEYVVRTRGSQCLYPNRSISAEVNLEPGRYEVLPKISATRDVEKPIVEDVIKKAAAENPQKLRQIGLNYDIAHAKGGFEEEEMARKKKLAERKKEKEEQLKKEKLREEKAETEKAKDGKAGNGKTEGLPAVAEKDGGKPEGKDDEDLKTGTGGEGKSDAEASDPAVAKEGGVGVGANKDEVGSKEEAKVDKKGEGEKPSGEKTSDTELNTKGEAKQSDEEQPKPDKPASSAIEPQPNAGPSAKESPNPWNAVAVIGLRVYSKDPELAIKLVKPKDPEEAAMLDVDGGVSGAGATT